MKKTRAELIEAVGRYRWYHTFDLGEGVTTTSQVPLFKDMWAFNLKCLESVDFRGKRVLDIGCRDGLFSFEAERRGAREVIGIDNDLSTGAVELLIPHFDSKVQMRQMNLYELTPETMGRFDVILFFGVLYHLRYPFWGLKRIIDCLEEQGVMALESGMNVSPYLKDVELLVCPVERSPYNEPTSCTFFNQLGLATTLRSMDCRLEQAWTFRPERTQFKPARGPWARLKQLGRRIFPKLPPSGSLIHDVARQLFLFRKEAGHATSAEYAYPTQERFSKEWADAYWNATHDEHTRGDRKLKQ